MPIRGSSKPASEVPRRPGSFAVRPGSPGYLSRRPGRRGLTLIEVVAALALMATLLVAVLAIKAGLARRRVAADRQLRAVAAADALLSGWWRDPATFPVDRSGVTPTDPSLTWSTLVLPNRDAARLGGRVVRVDVRDAAAVVASVDVLLPPAAEGRP